MSSFDPYAKTYRQTVEDSLALGGLSLDFFSMTKVIQLTRAVEQLGGNGCRALDVGCGIGALHSHLTGLFDQLDGVDISAQSIARAEMDNPANRYQTYDGKRLPYPDGFFDLVFTVCVIHHVDPDCWKDFVAELARVTRPGGLVAVIEHNPWNPLTLRTVARCPFDEDAVLLNHCRMQDLLIDSGLRQMGVDFFPFLPIDATWARRVDGWLRRLPLGAQYCLLARKEGA